MDRKVEFLRPRLTGARYEGHALPLDILKDVSVLEEFVVDVAKWIYLKKNPERKRAPKGFTDCISLKMSAIEPGSAMPVIDMHIENAENILFSTIEEDCFNDARDLILDTINAVGYGEDASSYLPSHLFGYFDRLGRRLQDGEEIEFLPEADRKAVLNRGVRKKLIFFSKSQEITDSINVVGRVYEVNQISLSYELMLTTGQKLPAKLDLTHLDDVLVAGNGFRDGLFVHIKGVGKYDKNDQLKEILETEQVTFLSHLDHLVQLEKLKGMRDGWLDGKGFSPSSENLDWLIKIFSKKYDDDLPSVYFYPTAEGGVQIEWSLGSSEISLELDFHNDLAFWHVLDLESDGETEKEFDLKEEGEWDWVFGELRKVRGNL